MDTYKKYLKLFQTILKFDLIVSNNVHLKDGLFEILLTNSSELYLMLTQKFEFEFERVY